MRCRGEVPGISLKSREIWGIPRDIDDVTGDLAKVKVKVII